MALRTDYEKESRITITAPIVQTQSLLRTELSVDDTFFESVNIFSTKRDNIVDLFNNTKIKDEITISRLDETMEFSIIDTYAQKFRSLFDSRIKDIGLIKNIQTPDPAYTETTDRNFQADKISEPTKQFSMSGFLSNNKMELSLGLLISALVYYTNKKGN